ncbi:voltage-gated chloride channel family protein [Flavobacterium soyangense]|uniref:Voltage-gated chloride channel family protein n=1 Tax=Flavobacterium soyangense TaxID=2023265 RepID=A0A930U6G2_9FLAO|nr:voltage-gated chloride channel family protein [Flavobacterium soyangense]MBF2707783.1 voltage-gated chloride channel family protein [Flavobacterium soyangense]
MNSKNAFLFTFKWILICVLIGVFSGSVSAFFLVSLEWVTPFREHNIWIIWLLPMGGLAIGLLYHYYGKEVVKGNNILLEEYEKPQKTIPLKMAPMVLIGTLITHLFGGSAGREGTAVQMGGAIADQLKNVFNLNNSDRKTLIILGISAGFTSVFGTPLAGALFALEVLYFSKISFKSVIFSFLVAYVAYFTVEFWQVKHTHYHIPIVPQMTIINFGWIIIIGILFGLTSMLFSRTTHFWGRLFSKTIQYAPLRPFVGGIILAVAIYFIGTTKYIGLGIPTIVESFSTQNASYDFLLKILFTGFTLGAGFKGGEVTPLFFIGATLGSALSIYVPLPIALLAGMGFVAVFSGATHTPIACTIMGMELFGIESGVFIGIACVVAYFSSGSIGIYHSQIVKGAKHRLYQRIKRQNLEDF